MNWLLIVSSVAVFVLIIVVFIVVAMSRDDPPPKVKLTSNDRAAEVRKGGTGIIKLSKDEEQTRKQLVDELVDRSLIAAPNVALYVGDDFGNVGSKIFAVVKIEKTTKIDSYKLDDTGKWVKSKVTAETDGIGEVMLDGDRVEVKGEDLFVNEEKLRLASRDPGTRFSNIFIPFETSAGKSRVPTCALASKLVCYNSDEKKDLYEKLSSECARRKDCTGFSVSKNETQGCLTACGPLHEREPARDAGSYFMKLTNEIKDVRTLPVPS